jgi:integrase
LVPKLIPFFGGTDIWEIDKEGAKAFYLNLLDLRQDNGEPYFYTHIRDILAMLKNILLEYRPTDVPEFPNHTLLPKKEKQWLGMKLQVKISPHIPEKYRLAIRTLQETGMHVGELRAPQVNDMVDGALKVWKAFGDRGLRLSRKSGGEVSYSISMDLWNDLLNHVEGKEPDDFIFTSDGKRPIGEVRLYQV